MYLLVMTDFDGDQEYYEFDNEDWWNWLTGPLLVQTMPQDLFDMYNESQAPWGETLESPQDFDSLHTKPEVLAHALSTDYMVPDRNKFETYTGYIQDIWT